VSSWSLIQLRGGPVGPCSTWRVADSRVGTYRFGQRERAIDIALGLVARPRGVFIDEPRRVLTRQKPGQPLSLTIIAATCADPGATTVCPHPTHTSMEASDLRTG